MSFQLIITEKPDAAKKLAYALSEKSVKSEKHKGVVIYKIKRNNKDIIIGCAAGHLFTIHSKEKTKSDYYPVYDIEWAPTYKINKQAKFTKKFYDTLKSLKKEVDDVVVACDYDIEGEVIGLNIIRYIFKRNDAKRMKFSTLTKPDLIKSYENMNPTLDWGQAYAGETRHKLDWLYGINLSKALTRSLKVAGAYKVMSIGRVQGPTLKILYQKEKEIDEFVPKKYWVLYFKATKKDLNKDLKEFIAYHKKTKFDDFSEAQSIFKKVNNKNGLVTDIQKKNILQQPPFPFDLTTLQLESYRVFHISPKDTLAIAQNLYLKSYCSYPRTSSQKLPPTIGYEKIISSLAKQKRYANLCNDLLNTVKQKSKKLKPNEGKKTDSAHPAIYPTGVIPSDLNERESKVYDLIVKRFLATFATPAKRMSTSITINVEGEEFITKGITTIEKGWHLFYEPYLNLKEEELPLFEEKEQINVKKYFLDEKETQPPKRYTPASIIKELEKRNLGTKATRANIIDILYKRGYTYGVPIKISGFGKATVEILEKDSPRILDEKLTRRFEDDMELIRKNKKNEEEVLNESIYYLDKILSDFKSKELTIGKKLKEALFKSNNDLNTIGDCPVCKKGKLIIKKGKYGKFIGCTNYPECKVTIKLSPNVTIRKTNEVCKYCGFPIVIVYQKSKKPQKMCINPDCPGKKKNTTNDTANNHINNEDNMNKDNNNKQKDINDKNKAKTKSKQRKSKDDLICPLCGAKLVKRKSIYGEFYGCSNYPKCKYTRKI